MGALNGKYISFDTGDVPGIVPGMGALNGKYISLDTGDVLGLSQVWEPWNP